MESLGIVGWDYTYVLRLRQATIETSTASIMMAANRPDKPATMVIMPCGSPSEVTLVTGKMHRERTRERERERE